MRSGEWGEGEGEEGKVLGTSSPPPSLTGSFNPDPRPQTNSEFAQSFLPIFRASNPHLEVLEEVRAGQHPFLRGEYREF